MKWNQKRGGREERKHSAMSAVEIEKGDRSDTKSTPVAPMRINP